MNVERRRSFADVLVRSIVPLLAFSGSAILSRPIATALGLTGVGSILARGFAPGLLGIAATVLTERTLDGGSLREAAARLGMARLNAAQIGVAIAATTPLAAAYAVLFLFLRVSSTPVEHWPLQTLKFIVAQGIAEELIFRGFVFRRLRPGRTFVRAASLSAVVFSLIHFANLVNGITPAALIGLCVSLVFAVILTYPAADLFERGGNSIWGFGLLHVAIDSINLFMDASAHGVGLVVYCTGIVATVPIVFWLEQRFLPARLIHAGGAVTKASGSGATESG